MGIANSPLIHFVTFRFHWPARDNLFLGITKLLDVHFFSSFFHKIIDRLCIWQLERFYTFLHREKIPIKITVLALYSCSIFTHTQTHIHAREKLVFDNLLYTEFYTVYNILYTVYSILYWIQYEINRKMKMLQEYWASTVIFIGIFSQCAIKHFQQFYFFKAIYSNE